LELTTDQIKYVEQRGRGATPLEAASLISASLPELVSIEMESNRAVSAALRERELINYSKRARIRETAIDAVVAIIGADPRNLVNDDGSAKNLKELDLDTALALARVKITETTTPYGETITRTEYVFSNKIQALKLLQEGLATKQDEGIIDVSNLVELTDEQLASYQQRLVSE
jgi:hypothetical protein